MNTPPERRTRVLLVQLYSFGDCLLATPLARQIKEDYPGCHLTWAIAPRCRDVLRGNPFVDEIWEVTLAPDHPVTPARSRDAATWDECARSMGERLARGEYDHAFLPFSGGLRNLHLYDGTVRGLMYNAYPRKVTVSLAPVLRLDEQEIERVRRFAEAHPAMGRCRQVILFECSPRSLQSPVNTAFALELSRRLLAEFEDLCIVLSSNVRLEAPGERLIDASVLSFRENAELTKYCTLLVGCSSGVTWLSTSDGAKPLPTVQILGSRAPIPNSLAVDHERFGLPTADIVELIDPTMEHTQECLRVVLREGIEPARTRFHQRMSLTRSYAEFVVQLLRQGHFGQAVVYWWKVCARERWHPALALETALILWRYALWLGKQVARPVVRLVRPRKS